jgi:hypothetical protein
MPSLHQQSARRASESIGTSMKGTMIGSDALAPARTFVTIPTDRCILQAFPTVPAMIA